MRSGRDKLIYQMNYKDLAQVSEYTISLIDDIVLEIHNMMKQYEISSDDYHIGLVGERPFLSKPRITDIELYIYNREERTDELVLDMYRNMSADIWHNRFRFSISDLTLKRLRREKIE